MTPQCPAFLSTLCEWTQYTPILQQITGSQIASFLFGVLVVVVFSTDHYKVPTYAKTTIGEFIELAPESLTSHSRYMKGLGIYISLMLAFYFILLAIGPTAIAPILSFFPGGSGGKRGVLTKRGVTQAITTKEIRYLNRDGANNQDTGTATPGEYYLAVSLTRKADDTAFTIPVTLTVGLQGAAGTGEPEYVKDATPGSTESPTPSPEPAEESSQPSGETTQANGPIRDDSADDGDGPPITLVAGLGGGGILLAILGTWAILRRRHQVSRLR